MNRQARLLTSGTWQNMGNVTIHQAAKDLVLRYLRAGEFEHEQLVKGLVFRVEVIDSDDPDRKILVEVRAGVSLDIVNPRGGADKAEVRKVSHTGFTDYPVVRTDTLG